NVRSLTVAGPVSGPLNISRGCPRSVLDMARALRPAGAPAPTVVGGYRPGDVRHVFASPQRAQDRLGFVARIGFEDGMGEFRTAALRGPVTGGEVR
ncbi:MAG: NAD-dependent epimerase/dehydratase family protein, partial [Ilumatobacteraceae bacterium]